MDGGRRLLRSLGAALVASLSQASHAAQPFALAGANDPFALSDLSRTAARLPNRLAGRRRKLRSALHRFAHSRLVGSCLVLALLAGAIAYGALKGGRYADLVATQGSIPDIAAKAAGFAIKAVTITGTHELSEGEVLTLAGVSPRNSLVFLDAAKIRERLKAVPLIKDASVSKLYPNRLLIEIEERQPFALWQKDGNVSIVAADGTPVDVMKDRRFEHLPLVVGEGANGKLNEYVGVLDAAGDLRERTRAGIYIAGRRWTLKMDNGVEIELPERNPGDAVTRLASVEHDGHILEKDVISIDLRIPGRMAVRLTAEAAAARADLAAKKAKKKGAAT